MSHAYLISTNNIQKCMEVLLNVIKNIFCNDSYKKNCNKCSLCHLIDINSLPSLKIIEPDGNFIKKEQIQELKNLFSKESQYTKENIYIIKNCERMNKESANTMLKFLEEPSGNVIGFFLTNHQDNVLLTIQSRCQQIDINFNNNEYEKFNLDEETYHKYIEIIESYLNDIEVNKKKLILYNKIYLSDFDKEDIKNIFKIILSIYEETLQNKYLGKDNLIKYTYLKDNSTMKLKKKVELIVNFLKEINYNVNIDLLLDRFVIEMDGINHETI